MDKDLGALGQVALEQELVQGDLGRAPLVQVRVNCACTFYLGLLRKANWTKIYSSAIPKVCFYYLTNCNYLLEKVSLTKMNDKMPGKMANKLKYN